MLVKMTSRRTVPCSKALRCETPRQKGSKASGSARAQLAGIYNWKSLEEFLTEQKLEEERGGRAWWRLWFDKAR